MVKLVIVIRKDLGMRRGKEISQGGHASGAWLSRRVQKTVNSGDELLLSEEEKEWINGSFTKACVQVNSEAELLEVHQKAKEAGLNSILITDMGLTEFNGVPTNTCCGIGPHEVEKFTGITSHLKLY